MDTLQEEGELSRTLVNHDDTLEMYQVRAGSFYRRFNRRHR